MKRFNYYDFYTFLLKHNVLGEFVFNCKKYGFKLYKSLEEYYKNTESEHLIDGSFIWACSFEGFDFWNNLNKIYRNENKANF